MSDRWSELKDWIIRQADASKDSEIALLLVLSKMREIEERDRREMRACYYDRGSFDGED